MTCMLPHHYSVLFQSLLSKFQSFSMKRCELFVVQGFGIKTVSVSFILKQITERTQTASGQHTCPSSPSRLVDFTVEYFLPHFQIHKPIQKRKVLDGKGRFSLKRICTPLS